MASKVRLSRHVYLRTQQRRLRHVRSILVRNLNVPTSEDLHDPLSTCVYFTLHSQKCPEEVIYTSRRVSGSYNPSWEALLFRSAHGAIHTFIVRLWVSMDPGEEQFNVVYEKIINLSDLLYIGTQLNKDISLNPAVGNSFIIGMHEGFYSDGAVTGAPSPPPVSHPLAQFLPAQSLMEVPRTEVLSAYENNTVLKLLSRQKALNMAKLKSDRARTEVKTFLFQHSAHFGANMEKEELRSRIAVLKQQLFSQKGIEEEEQRTLSCLRRDQDVVEARLHYKQDELRHKKAYFREEQLCHAKEMAKLQRVKLHKRMRQNNMVFELCEAFCIKEEKDHFTICDVILPTVDQLDAMVSTEQLGVALGYTAHLVEQLGKVLLVPLPYPLKPNGSRSTVFDHISDESYTDNIKEFPLYVKNSSDKWLYRYAMFLLTKDIIQLRLHCGVRTSRQMYKKTLCCLKELLDRLVPVYQPDVSTTKQQIPDIRQKRTALNSMESELRLRDIMGPFTDDPAQSFTPDPPSQASDQPSQLSDPCSDFGFNIDEFQSSSVVTESLQVSVAVGDVSEDSGQPLSEDNRQPFSEDSRQPLSEDSRQPFSGDSRQPFSEDSRQPFSEDSRQPFSEDSRQPLSGDSRQPLSGDSRQPLSGDSRQPFSEDSRQPLSEDSRQPLSEDSRQPLSEDSRQPFSVTGMTDSGEVRTAGVAGFHGAEHQVTMPPSPSCSTPVAHSPPLHCTSTTSCAAPPTIQEAECASSHAGDITMHQSTPASTGTMEAVAKQKDALNRVFDEIFAKRKLDSLMHNKEEGGNILHAPSSASSTYVSLLGPEGTAHQKDPVMGRQERGRASEESEVCRLEDFIDSPPVRAQRIVTYQSLCELSECTDQNVNGLDTGVVGGDSSSS